MDTSSDRAEGEAPERVDVERDLGYWTQRLGVGEDELRAIVQQVGPDAAKVEAYVRDASPGH